MRSLLWFVLLLSGGVALAGPPAGGFTVSPVRLDMDAGARAVSLTLSNGSDRIKTVQVEAVRWTQVEGEDHYEPAPELVVNPPLFRVAPGARQVVRAGFHGGAPALEAEGAYRVYLQEVPDGDEPRANQLRLLLRIGVPLFLAPVEPAQPAPRWTLARQPDGRLALQVRNEGRRRLRLEHLAVAAEGQALHDVAGLSYVLSGQMRAWTLPAGLRAPLRLAASSDGEPVDVALAAP